MHPELSVVVVAFTRRTDLLLACVKAIADSHGPCRIEVVVVSSGPIPAIESLESLSTRFAGGLAVHEGAGMTIPHLRRFGITKTRGDVVALIEDDCIVATDWVRAILAAHQEQHAAVGGAVEPGSYRRSIDWAAYLSDYSRFMLPFGREVSTRLPGNNVSYKRNVINELLAITAEQGLQETFVHQKWHGEGKSLLAEPAAIVRNEHRWGVRDVVAVPFHHGRAFGGQRAQHWGAARRAAFALASAGLPLMHVARIVQRVRRRGGTVPVMRALPWLGVFGLSWAAGECVGYAAGAGASLEQWR